MPAVLIGGRRLYGKIEQVGSTYIATTFAFVQFLPLYPVRSHIVLGESSSGTHEVVHIKMHWKSVAVGYLRAWGIGATLVSSIPTLATANISELGWALSGAGTFLFFAGVTTAAFTWIGRLSNAEKAKRLIYARFAVHPVDPGVLDEDLRGKVGARLRSLLEERAATLESASGYRQGGRANVGYRVFALDPSVRDREYLEMAMMLARIDASLSVGGSRAEAERAHDAIWSKLVAEHPDVIGVVREAEAVQRSFVASALGYIPLVLALGLVGLALSRNDHVIRPAAGASGQEREYGFVPEELLR